MSSGGAESVMIHRGAYAAAATAVVQSVNRLVGWLVGAIESWRLCGKELLVEVSKVMVGM